VGQGLWYNAQRHVQEVGDVSWLRHHRAEEQGVDAKRVAQFQELIALEPNDTMLRFGLGELYIDARDFARAAEQFAEIVRLDPQYSAAYRYLGQSYAALDKRSEAVEVFTRGIAIAEARGDLQTAKEMQVFLRRLDQNPSEQKSAKKRGD